MARRKTIFGKIKNADELYAHIKSIPDEEYKLQYHCGNYFVDNINNYIIVN